MNTQNPETDLTLLEEITKAQESLAAENEKALQRTEEFRVSLNAAFEEANKACGAYLEELEKAPQLEIPEE